MALKRRKNEIEGYRENMFAYDFPWDHPPACELNWKLCFWCQTEANECPIEGAFFCQFFEEDRENKNSADWWRKMICDLIDIIKQSTRPILFNQWDPSNTKKCQNGHNGSSNPNLLILRRRRSKFEPNVYRKKSRGRIKNWIEAAHERRNDHREGQPTQTSW